jgi:hypothetical protein
VESLAALSTGFSNLGDSVLAWEDIEPINVAAYIEIFNARPRRLLSKQHMAAIWMLFSWLTEKGVLAMNPAREFKTERFSRTEGKTPAFVGGEVQKLWTRSKRPRSPACAIALCSGSLPTLSPGSAGARDRLCKFRHPEM